VSKTILAHVKGWTPVIDGLAKDTSVITALIFGRIWRFCQMEDGICKKSLTELAEEMGMDRHTLYDHAQILVDQGYLEDLTPALRNAPHRYRDTGKAGLHIGVSAGVESTSDGGGLNAIDKGLVAVSVPAAGAAGAMKKEKKEKDKKDFLSSFKGIEASIMEDRLTTQEDIDYTFKAGGVDVPEAYLWMAEEFMRGSGFEISKANRSDWLATFAEWAELRPARNEILKSINTIKSEGKIRISRPGSITFMLKDIIGRRRTSNVVLVSQEVDPMEGKRMSFSERERLKKEVPIDS
jgi:hypothetical protein